MDGSLVIGNALDTFIRWMVRRVGGRNLLLLGLLMLAVGSVALGTADRIRGVDPSLALTMAALGALAGWIASATGWAAWVAGVLTAGLGVGTVFLRVGRLSDELGALFAAGSRLSWTYLHGPISGIPPELVEVIGALAALGRGGATIMTRVSEWGRTLVEGNPAFDPVAVALVWALGLWAVSAWAGWLICRRERPLHAVAPAGALLLTAFYHVWGSHIFLLGLLLAVFLLMAMVSYDRRMRRWSVRNVDYPELRAQTAMAALLVSLVLVTMAQAVPSVSADQIADLVRGAEDEGSERAERVTESFGLERRGRPAVQAVERGGLPRRHLLGSGPELSEDVVMVVSTGELAPGAPEMAGIEPPRYYWRSHTYDIYTGRGWRAGETTSVSYGAATPAVTATLGTSTTERVVRQAVQMVGDGGKLVHVAGTLVAVDHDYVVAWRSHDDLFAATVEADRYRADSVVPVADERGLRAAVTDYPAWVEERYLALPDTVPQRVLALARDLTATAPTPYDRASAIEGYLRGFPYTLDVSAPPGDRDVVDFFVFDVQKGYCDYYASAMVVLARAAGLPARLAVGYAPGTYDRGEGHHVVTEADAHAWPEVYFPGYGWVRFEPTAGLPAEERPEQGAPVEWTAPEEPLEPVRPARGGISWWRVLIVGITAIGAAAAIWVSVVRWRLRRQDPRAALTAIYGRMRRQAQPITVNARPGDTPNEFGVTLGGWLRDFSGIGPLRGFVAQGAPELDRLVQLYARSLYSARRADAGDRAVALRIWGRLRWRLLVGRWWQRIAGRG